MFRSSSTSAGASEDDPPMNTTRRGAARSWAMSVNSVGMTSKRLDRVSIPARVQTPSRTKHEIRQAIGGLERVGGHAELPLRSPEFGVHLRHGLDRAVVRAIEIPPARTTIRYEIEIPVRRPFRLKHRLVWPARDSARICYGPIREDVPEPGLGRHPRHIGMSPREPGHARSDELV